MDQWEQCVWRFINLFYRCAAVHSVDLAARGERFRCWTVRLRGGNDQAWIVPHIPALVEFIRGLREDAGLQAALDEIEVIGMEE